MVRSSRVAIAADSPLTVEAGLALAEAGGNAVDIAVGAALAATVAEILMCSLGGSGYLMLRWPGGGSELFDGADRMPRRRGGQPQGSFDVWDVDLPYGDGITVRAGPASVAVPGLLRALEAAWRRHGQLPWEQVVAPSLGLAREGFPLGRTTAAWLELAGPLLFHRQPASRACFCPDSGRMPRAGDRFRVPDMAATLELIAREGARAFYEGEIAAAFAAAMADLGGLVDRRDLAACRVEVRRPLQLRSDGFVLELNPPPAIGGLALGSLLQLLAVEAAEDTAAHPGRAEASWARRQVRAQLALASVRREARRCTPLEDSRAAALLDPAYLGRHHRAASSPHTTHLSVATADGALVAVTLSNGYGSGITIPGTGIACNNSLGEPELNPAGFLAAAAGSCLISNMAPTIARHPDGRAYAFGSPGASRITTALAQMWDRHGPGGLALDAAIEAPRLHLNADVDPPLLLWEPGVDLSLVDAPLPVRGFSGPDMYFGGIKLAGLDRDGDLIAFADRRRHGSVAIHPA